MDLREPRDLSNQRCAIAAICRREFDVAAMALVISFVTDASKAVAEMKRVVKRHGTVAAYIGTRWVEASSKGPMAGAAAMLGAAVAWFAACAGGRDRDGEERSVLYGWWHQASWNGRRGTVGRGGAAPPPRGA
jgi:hypothetical protein